MSKGDEMVWTEASAQTELARFCGAKQHKLTIPNFGAFPYFENDLVSITNADISHVFEIKVSRSDFLCEFGPGRAARNKFDRLSAYNRKAHEGANYFWLVCPGDVLKSHKEVPEWAGIIVLNQYDSGWYFNHVIERQAPKLHREKTSDETLAAIGRGLCIRYWNRRKSEDINR